MEVAPQDSVLQCITVQCSVWQCVAVCCSVLRCDTLPMCLRTYDLHLGSVLQCIAVCCSVLQCVAVCCSEIPFQYACAPTPGTHTPL